MTKKKFLSLDVKELKCRCCNRILPISNFSYQDIKDDGMGTCKVCTWIKRHNGLPLIKNYDKKQIFKALDFVILNNSIYVNDLACLLNINLDNAILLIQNLHIGNKKCMVKSKCSYCGKEIENVMCIYQQRKHLYCNQECYWKHKPIIEGSGEDNWQYKRIETTCTNCGKSMKIIPARYNQKNKYGDNHNFCSKECYWKYRSKYYIEDKSAGANRVYTEEQRNNARIKAIENSRSAKRFNSKIQLKVNNILDNINIPYEREYVIKYYAIDNYLNDTGLMIEVMGDYWHASPLIFNENKYLINDIQRRGLQTDKQKHTYVKNHYNVEILYLWESDIDNNIELCTKLIKQYISSNGILENYHSFNWFVDANNKLKLKTDIIIPYQDMKTDEYRNIIKKKVG